MQKLIVSTTIALSLFAAPLALAQPYYAGACVSIPAGIAVGSRGPNVSNLQTFLVSRNYPGSGSWMITGYFGQATAAAVRNFQQSQGIPSMGMVDSTTAAAISHISCLPLAGQGGGASFYPTPYPQPLPLPIPTPVPLPYYYGGTPTITSLSQNTGMSGNVVTIYGVGFGNLNNTVNFGATALHNILSANGTSLTFTVPSNIYAYSAVGTSAQITVQNSRGTSNAVAFTIWGSPFNCGAYGYGNSNCGSCLTTGQVGNYYPYTSLYLPIGQAGNSYYPYCPLPNTTTPVISYLTPTSGAVGTSVTVYGSGFSTGGNTVRFGTGIIANLNSSDGHSVSFVVPNTLIGYGSQPITLSTYQVSVSNSAGYTSNSMPFTVTGLIGSGGAPTIASVTGPTTLTTNTQGLWTVNVNTQNNSYLTLSVNWGDQNVYGSTGSPQVAYSAVQQVNTMTHTYYQGGTYTITFTVSNSAGQKNTYTTTVVVSGTSNNLSLSYLSPSSGRVGTQIVVQGTGFSQYDNAVHFGVGGMQHVASQNSTTIYYTIPYAVSPCDFIGPSCAASAQLVMPGSYPIYVVNANGTSNSLTFNVQ